MANLSDLTRKQQVLAYLKARTGIWVDGPELANEEVGGSEGLRRLRELRDEDKFNIQTRQHPDPNRDINQYRIVPGKWVGPALVDESITAVSAPAQVTRGSFAAATFPEPPAAESPWPADHGQARISDAVRRKEDGTFEYVPPQAPLVEPQLTIPVDEPVQPPEARFSSLPPKIDYGAVAICPRCKSKTTSGRSKKKDDQSKPTMEVERRRKKNDDGSMPLTDDDGVLLFRDPHSRKPRPCERCNGYGIVPNQGPISLTKPTGPEKPAPLALEDEAPSIEAFE